MIVQLQRIPGTIQLFSFRPGQNDRLKVGMMERAFPYTVISTNPDFTVPEKWKRHIYVHTGRILVVKGVPVGHRPVTDENLCSFISPCLREEVYEVISFRIRLYYEAFEVLVYTACKICPCATPIRRVKDFPDVGRPGSVLQAGIDDIRIIGGNFKK